MEVLTNLHLIDGKRSNIYLWVGEEGLTLIDAGSPGDSVIIFDYIRSIGFQPSDLVSILITHADIDHVGCVTKILQQNEATVYAGSRTADLLVAGKSAKHMPRLVQFVIDHFMPYEPVSADSIQIVSDGDAVSAIDQWQVIASPGHTFGHQAYCSNLKGILFAGDALNTRGDRLKVSPKRINADQVAAQQSAMRLLKLHPAVIACGHGRPLHGHDAAEILTLYREIEAQLPSLIR